jgi:hypothetical protein
MSLSIGIVGLPNVGKSTLFNSLTKKSVNTANYPFCTIDPAVGVVAVPDGRLQKLSKFSASAKTIPAVVEFVDIAGLVEGAARGEGLGNQFLAHIREVDAIAEVVRIFEDENIAHVSGSIDPMRDVEVINLELVLADFQTVTKRLALISREVKRGDKDAMREQKVLEKVESALDAGKFASSLEYSGQELSVIKNLHLLTLKPILYVLNINSQGQNLDREKNKQYKKLLDFFISSGSKWVMVDAAAKDTLNNLNFREEEQLSDEKDGNKGGIDSLISESYVLLGLITFFTTGPAETRAWTIKEGTSAKEAGAVIHSDFRDKFIRAEVIFWRDLLEAGSYAAAREKGFIRTEGKNYIMRDGDVVEFKI